MLKERILYNNEMEPEIYMDEEGVYEYKISDIENYEVYQKISTINSYYLKKVKILSVFEGKFAYAEKYVFGRTLSELLDEEVLKQSQAKKWIHELINAIETLHEKGVIHRDIKPDNIVISELGTLVLIDFNISRLYKENQENDTTLFGTKGYAPPEQFGFSQTSSKTDYYALGKVIELIAKKADLNLEKVVKKCTYFNPENRYHDIDDIRRDINRYSKDIEYEKIDSVDRTNGMLSDKISTKIMKIIWSKYQKEWTIKRKALNWLDLFWFILVVYACLSVIVEEASANSIIEMYLVIIYFILIGGMAIRSFRSSKTATKYYVVFGIYIGSAAIFTVIHNIFNIFG